MSWTYFNKIKYSTNNIIHTHKYLHIFYIYVYIYIILSKTWLIKIKKKKTNRYLQCSLDGQLES